jgi:catechol 2,3-dioxygenase-like lactoylglutathione lyase family enzyme/predicted enzyme related to lactoylglutathione lyase
MPQLRKIVSRVALCLLASLACLSLGAQGQPKRPRIMGIAYVQVYVIDTGKSCAFYATTIGVQASAAGCAGVSHPRFWINGGQSIQLEQAPSPPSANWLAEVAFTTDNVARMHRYLLAHGIKVGAVVKDPSGLPHFELADPEGNRIAFMQRPSPVEDYPIIYDQIAKRLFHAGFVVRDAALEDRFYRDLLGFRMYWHGGFKDNDVDWEELQVPDGSDWIEYMLNISPTADHKELGIQNHFSLGVVNVKTAYDLLLAHGLKPSADDKPEIGRDGKWSFDIYDPDDTRVEFMEFQPAQKPCCHPYEAAHPVP